MSEEGSNTQIEIRDLIAGIIATTVEADDMGSIEKAAGMIDAMFHKMLLSFGRHAEGAGCERCGELVHDLSAAKNASDSEAFDYAVNELYSHMSLEEDLTDLSWLN